MTTPNTARPEAPQFKLRRLGGVAYAMSVSTGGVGQILFLGLAFGGHPWSYIVATFLAAFAEVVMAASGDKALDHRANGRSWVPLLILAIAVACYAASMNVVHFVEDNPALAWTFGGASLIGWLMHIIDGNIRVAAYLRDDTAYRAQQTNTPAPVPAPQPKPAAKQPRLEQPVPAAQREAAPQRPAAPVPPTPGAAAATEPVPANVRELRPATKTTVKRIDLEEVYAWFANEVTTKHNGDPMKVSGPAIDEQFGTNDYLKKQIKPFRERYARENLTAVNQ